MNAKNAHRLSEFVPVAALPPQSETGRLLAIRRQILAGTYLTDDKLEIAIDRVMMALQVDPLVQRVDRGRSGRRWA